MWLWDTGRLKLLTHLHTVTKWQNWDFSPGCLAPESLLFSTLDLFHIVRVKNGSPGFWGCRRGLSVVLAQDLLDMEVNSFRPPLSHRTQSKGIVVRPFSHWLPFGEESPAFLSLGHQFWDFRFVCVKTLPCLVLREANPWLFFSHTKWTKFLVLTF